MWTQFTTAFATLPTWAAQIIQIIFFFSVAWLVHRGTSSSARVIVALTRRIYRRRTLRSERLQTLQGLISSLTSSLAFTAAALVSLSLFIEPDTIVWMVGLFAAAFGLGARPLVSDVLTGVGFLFSDPYDVGDKVELLGTVQGVVEAVHLQYTVVRSQTGELYVVPNGEVRLIRNFSRGRFSMADVVLKVDAADVDHAVHVLQALSTDALAELPNLLEPWQVISKTGALGQHTELNIIAKARFGKAAELRTRMLSLVQETLAAEGIELR